MLRLRHLALLTRDLVGFASAGRAWWIVPVALVAVLLAAVVSAANTALPYAVYTLF